jgi:hypothetical protein
MSLALEARERQVMAKLVARNVKPRHLAACFRTRAWTDTQIVDVLLQHVTETLSNNAPGRPNTAYPAVPLLQALQDVAARIDKDAAEVSVAFTAAAALVVSAMYKCSPEGFKNLYHRLPLGALSDRFAARIVCLVWETVRPPVRPFLDFKALLWSLLQDALLNGQPEAALSLWKAGSSQDEDDDPAQGRGPSKGTLRKYLDYLGLGVFRAVGMLPDQKTRNCFGHIVSHIAATMSRSELTRKDICATMVQNLLRAGNACLRNGLLAPCVLLLRSLVMAGCDCGNDLWRLFVGSPVCVTSCVWNASEQLLLREKKSNSDSNDETTTDETNDETTEMKLHVSLFSSCGVIFIKFLKFLNSENPAESSAGDLLNGVFGLVGRFVRVSLLAPCPVHSPQKTQNWKKDCCCSVAKPAEFMAALKPWHQVPPKLRVAYVAFREACEQAAPDDDNAGPVQRPLETVVVDDDDDDVRDCAQLHIACRALTEDLSDYDDEQKRIALPALEAVRQRYYMPHIAALPLPHAAAAQLARRTLPKALYPPADAPFPARALEQGIWSWSELRLLVDSGQLELVGAVREALLLHRRSDELTNDDLVDFLRLRLERGERDFALCPNRILAELHKAALTAASERLRLCGLGPAADRLEHLDFMKILKGALQHEGVDPFIPRRHDALLQRLSGSRLLETPAAESVVSFFKNPAECQGPALARRLLSAGRDGGSAAWQALLAGAMDFAACSGAGASERFAWSMMRAALLDHEVDEVFVVQCVMDLPRDVQGPFISVFRDATLAAALPNGNTLTEGWITARCELDESSFAHLFSSPQRRAQSMRRATRNFCHLLFKATKSGRPWHGLPFEKHARDLRYVDVKLALHVLQINDLCVTPEEAASLMRRGPMQLIESAEERGAAEECLQEWLHDAAKQLD